jgi:hypothetical protein
MLKKICFSIIAILVVSLASAVAFAQNTNISEDQIKTFLTVYANPDPTAVATASAGLGAGAADFGVVATKIITIHQLKNSGLSGDTLATQLSGMPAPMTITPAELDLYNAQEGELKPVIEKFLAGAAG